MGKYHFPRNTPFQDRLKKTEQGCLEWQGARTSLGYGIIRVGKKTYKAHRWFFEQAHGYEPNVVRHTCDNPSCCNLDHLIDGTQAENLADCIQKGRARRNVLRGEKHPLSKLTATNVIAIRTRYANGGVSQMQLAREYGISQKVIWAIINNKTWK